MIAVENVDYFGGCPYFVVQVYARLYDSLSLNMRTTRKYEIYSTSAYGVGYLRKPAMPQVVVRSIN